MSASRILVWRHGRTDWNATGRFQGHADVPLNEDGVVQAKRSAEALALLRPRAIVSSDLDRASQTAAALSLATGVPVLLDRRLREIDVGTWQGLSRDEILAVDPDLAARFFAGEDVRRSPSGETVGEVGRRAGAALAEIGAAAPDGSTVVVCTHGVAGRAGVCHLVGLPVEHWRLLGGLHNCAWVTLERHRGGFWRIRDYNVTVA